MLTSTRTHAIEEETVKQRQYQRVEFFFLPTIFSRSEQLLWTSNETHPDRFSKRNATTPL